MDTLVTNITAMNAASWNVTGWSWTVNGKAVSSDDAMMVRLESGDKVQLIINLKAGANYVFDNAGITTSVKLGETGSEVQGACVVNTEDNTLATITYTWASIA